MKRLISILALFTCALLVSGQYMLRISPQLTGTATALVLHVTQYDEYDVTLAANTPIKWDVPVLTGGVVQSGTSYVNRISGLTILQTTPNYCETQYWSYNQAAKQVVLESTSPVPPNLSNALPINALPNQTGNYNAQNFKLQNVAPAGAAGDVLSEGNPIGAIAPASVSSSGGALNGSIGATTPAAATVTALTAHGALALTGQSSGGNAVSPVDLNGMINVLDQGIVCDGSTDNNPSSSGPLQTAIYTARAIAGTGTGEVDIPASCNASSGHQLNFSTGITVPDNITIRGLAGSAKDSNTVGVEMDYTGSGTAITSTSTHGVQLKNFRLRTSTGTDGILLNGTFAAVLDGLDVQGFSGNGYHYSVGGSSSIWNTLENSSASNNGTDLFLDGTAAAAKAVGGNLFLNDHFDKSSGTSNVVLTSFSASTAASGYDNVYQNNFVSPDISGGGGAVTVGLTSNASLNTTLSNVTAESLNTIYALNTGTVNFQALGSEGAVNANSTTGPISADGAATYNICWDFLGGIGTPECATQLTSKTSYSQPVTLQEQTDTVGAGKHPNLLLNSDAFSAGSWITSGITSVTDNNQPNQAGVPNSASAVVVTAGGASFIQQVYNKGSSVANLCYTGMVQARTASGTAHVQSLVTDGAGITDGGLNTVILTTTWTRLIVTGCAGGSDASTTITYRPIYFSSNAPTVTIYLADAQLVQSNVPAAYQPTGATAYTATDVALMLNNGGHFISDGGTLPTVGTGTVTAGGTDNAMEVTGATSPATVTFATPFLNKPICTCSDETAALGACKVVPTATTAVVTTTGTDSFDLVCVGK